MRSGLRIAGLLALLPILTAGSCAHTGDLDGIPEERLVCPDEPNKPEGQGPNGEVTDEENNTYLRGLRGAYLGCRQDVDWIRDYVNGR